MTFGIGAVLALVAMCIGIFVASPAGMRASALGATIAAAGKPPTAEQVVEMQRLQARLGVASTLGAALLALTTIAMAVARYVP